MRWWAEVAAGRRAPRPALEAAYASWPGDDHDKTTLKALLLRLRIEDLVRSLPSTVIAGAPNTNLVRQRLMLSIGEPGLSLVERERRLAVVMAAKSAYGAICDVLHGRDPEGRPPLALVTTWEDAVVRLERELARPSVPPAQRAEAALPTQVEQ
jgi:hypothetical protein